MVLVTLRPVNGRNGQEGPITCDEDYRQPNSRQWVTPVTYAEPMRAVKDCLD